MKKRDYRVLRILISILLLVSLVYFSDVKSLYHVLSNLTFPVIVFLMAISFVLVFLSAFKWWLFIKSYGKNVTMSRLYALYLMGYFVNLLVPSYIGGDVLRSMYIGKKIGQHEAFSATILERYTGMVAMVILAIVAIFVVPSITFQMRIVIICLGLGLVFLTLVAVSPRLSVFLTKIPAGKIIIPHAKKIQDALQLATKNRKLIFHSLTLSFLFHLVAVLNVVACGYAVGWIDSPILSLIAVLPVILLIGSVPLTPSGLGIQEGAYFFFLQTLGATRPEALGVALILRAKGYVLAVIGWIIWLIEKKEGELDATYLSLGCPNAVHENQKASEGRVPTRQGN